MPESLKIDRVRLVTFDAGGTLLAPFPSVGEIYAEVLSRQGVVVAAEVLNSRFRQTFKEMTAARPRPVVNEETEIRFWRELVRRCIEPECPANRVNLVFAQLWEEFATARRWAVLPGAKETLGKLTAARKMPLAVLSNWDSRLHRTLEALDLKRYFARVFISSELGAEKPDIRAFRAVEQIMGIPARQCLHIGDHYAHDYTAARNAGWQAILISPTPPESDPRAIRITDLNELPALLA